MVNVNNHFVVIIDTEIGANSLNQYEMVPNAWHVRGVDNFWEVSL